MALRAAAIGAVVAATIVGGLLATWAFTAQRTVSAGTISLSVSPFHDGTFDVYVPVVDWGVRFGGVRAPARLTVELQSVDRDEAARVAKGGLTALDPVRAEARDAVASYLKELAALAFLGALGLGALVIAALRPRGRRRWAYGATVLIGSIAWPVAIATLLAPRGDLSSPQYYAHGGDIPAALRVAENAARSPTNLGDELDGQLLGLARLVNAPGARTSVAGLPRLTVASDLHNNVVAIDAIKSAAAGGPVFLAGDLTDRGTPTEVSAIGAVTKTGKPVVIVGGNHDSDAGDRTLARKGAIVLTRRGRLLPNGHHGPIVAVVGGLRVAGYESPNLRTASDHYADHGAQITPLEQAAFTAWLQPLLGKVDVIVLHEPALADPAIGALHDSPPKQPLMFIEGHTHHQAVDVHNGITIVNGGTAGAGGTGNLTERLPIGLAIVIYRRRPYSPLAADLVQIAPGTGGGTARRIRLDNGPLTVGDPDATSPETPVLPPP